MVHVRKVERFPGFGIGAGDGQRSSEQAGANSFTRRQISIGQELRSVA